MPLHAEEGLLDELFKRFTKDKISIGSARGAYTGNGERLLSHLHHAQMRVAQDKSKRISVTCSRRAGKTVLDVALLGRTAENYPDSLCIYITITRKSAKAIVWKEFKRLNKAYSLNWRFNEVETYITCPNGSIIAVAGADKYEEIEKFRGLAPSIVVIDEVKSFKAHLGNLIEEVLEPGLMDYDGPLLLTGTPGHIPVGIFWNASANPENHEWSRHSWMLLENPMHPRWAGLPDWQLKVKQYLASVLKKKGWTWDNPRFQREYLGKWCRDVSTLLYKYDPLTNHAKELPPGLDWRFVQGIDLGAKGTAFVTWAYAPNHPIAYAVWAEKHEAMLLGAIVKRGRELEQQFQPVMRRVIDEGGLGQMINSFLGRSGYNCAPAEKRNKLAFIQQMNDELSGGRIKLLPTARALLDEWIVLEMAEDGGEKPHSNNHCSDAGLYGWRCCRHYLPGVPGDPKPGEEGYDEWADEQLWSLDESTDEADQILQDSVGTWSQNLNGDSEVSRIMSGGWGDPC
jgi:hypothetical protein